MVLNLYNYPSGQDSLRGVGSTLQPVNHYWLEAEPKANIPEFQHSNWAEAHNLKHLVTKRWIAASI